MNQPQIGPSSALLVSVNNAIPTKDASSPQIVDLIRHYKGRGLLTSNSIADITGNAIWSNTHGILCKSYVQIDWKQAKASTVSFNLSQLIEVVIEDKNQVT